MTTKKIPLVKAKRVAGGMYRVYKWSPQAGNYKIKRTFYSMHQAKRYIKGFGEEAKLKIEAEDV